MSTIATASLSGECLIRTVHEQKHELISAFAVPGPVGLDVSGVTGADISFVQLLASAARTASGQNRPFRLIGVPDVLAQAFRRSGISVDAATGHLNQA